MVNNNLSVTIGKSRFEVGTHVLKDRTGRKLSGHYLLIWNTNPLLGDKCIFHETEIPASDVLTIIELLISFCILIEK